MPKKPFFLLDHLPENRVPWAIFDAEALDAPVPTGFNAVVITLDGRAKSDLEWKKERLAALRYTEQGLHIFWNLDLGLFGRLDSPLSDRPQYHALELSLQHFKDALWNEFQENSVGLCFYRGSANFYENFPWDEEQRQNFKGWLHEHVQTHSQFHEEKERLLSLFCSDVAAGYLNLFAQSLPDTLPLFVLLETEGVNDPLLLAHLLSKERFARLLRLSCEGVLPISSLMEAYPSTGYFGGTIGQPISLKEITVGVCFPSSPYSELLNEVLMTLSQRQIHFRVIPESLLMTEWDGLESIIVHRALMSPQGIRQLRGFAAAGGAIISCDKDRGLYVPFAEWIEANQY